MAIAELKLFGGFELRLASGEVADLLGQKDRALLAIMALPAGVAHSRDKLASLLWSDRGDEQARDSLRHSLTKLRQSMLSPAHQPIIADRLSARLDPVTVNIDVAEFERLVHEGTPQHWIERPRSITATCLMASAFTIRRSRSGSWLSGSAYAICTRKL